MTAPSITTKTATLITSSRRVIRNYGGLKMTGETEDGHGVDIYLAAEPDSLYGPFRATNVVVRGEAVTADLGAWIVQMRPHGGGILITLAPDFHKPISNWEGLARREAI